MSDSTDRHAPTNDFIEYLERDTLRRLRYETRFNGARPRTTWRSSSVMSIAAGVVLTLATGMVLGASANYASAEVLPNGTTLIPERPTLALLPIKSALSAIGCTQQSHTPARATVAATTDTASNATPAIAQTDSAQAVTYPDRALIATYVREHQPTVMRGDTTAGYVVMVLDAMHGYRWSTVGSGNVSIAVAGDMRSPAQRSEYNRLHRAEFRGEQSITLKPFVLDSAVSLRFERGYFVQLDSAKLRMRLRGGSVSDSGMFFRYRRLGDSLNLRLYSGLLARARGDSGVVISMKGGSARGNAASANVATDFGVAYTSGWSIGSNAMVNQAAGLQATGNGDSGIAGLPAANISSADVFTFAPGELAPHQVRVMVVHVTPGTSWTGR